jgi:probable F420-dependent oxidoreductase
MGRKRWSLSVPLDGFSLPELGEVAQEAERLGYTDAWSFEVDGFDGFMPLGVIGLRTRMRLGTAIANVYTRGPATLAMTAAGLAEVAPGGFCLGLGSGSQVIVEAWNGIPFSRPVTRVREMAQVLRAALAGERVVFKGETLSVDGFRLSRPPARPVPIYIAALRPGMLRVAGEVGDGVILNWGSPEDVPRSVAVVREAARKAGRDPDALEITARLFISLDPPGPESDQAVRRHIAAYLNVPVYRAYQEWLGRSAALAPMWAAWAAGDRKGALAAIPEQVIDDLIGRGSLAGIRRRVQRYLDAGLDTAFLGFFTGEQDPARKRALVMEAIRALAPSAP